MRIPKTLALLTASLLLAACILPANAETNTLHLEARETTSKLAFPRFLRMYHVMNGEQSQGRALSLHGTLSIENKTADFSEILWMIAYWKDGCPANDLAMKGAHSIWSSIQKFPQSGKATFPVNLRFPAPLPITGCVGLIFEGGPVTAHVPVTMSADLNLEYEPISAEGAQLIGLDGEYCFGQNWGCQNATLSNDNAFAVPVTLPKGNLTGLYGNISDSAFDGKPNFGPLPTGTSWGAINESYLLPNGCARFQQNLNDKHFPNAQPIATLRSWLPKDAVQLATVPLEQKISPTGEGASKALETNVEKKFSQPIPSTPATAW